MFTMRGFRTLILALSTSFGLAQAAVTLGSASTFGALSYASIVNTGATEIIGDIGTTGTSIAGFPPGVYTGNQYISSQAIPAFQAAEAAYQAVASLTGATELTGNLGGRTLLPGVYEFPSSVQLSGTLTLVGTGSPDDAWYFQIGSTLTTAIESEIMIVGGGQPCNVFWKVGTSATLGPNSEFLGNILAAVSITADDQSIIIGGLFALGGSITLNSNLVQPQSCLSGTTTSSSSTSSSATTTSSTFSTSSTTSSTSSAATTTSSTSTSSSATTTSSTSSTSSSATATSSTSSTSSTTTISSTSSTSSTTSSTSSAATTTSSTSSTSTTSSSSSSSLTTTSSMSSTSFATTTSSTSLTISTSSSTSSSATTTSSLSYSNSSTLSSSATTTYSILYSNSSTLSSSSLPTALCSLRVSSTGTSSLLVSSSAVVSTSSIILSSSVALSSTGVSELIQSTSIPALTTSTVFMTNIYTITKCPLSVTNCPVGSVTTDIISLYTTICPVTQTATDSALAPLSALIKSSGVPAASAGPLMSTSVLLTQATPPAGSASASNLPLYVPSPMVFKNASLISTSTRPEGTGATSALLSKNVSSISTPAQSTGMAATSITIQPSGTYLGLTTNSGARNWGISKGLGLIFIIFIIVF